MNWTAFWPTLIPLAGTLLTFVFSEFGPAIAAFVTAHPTWGGLVATAVVGLANVLKSPRA